jgi:hypothetical protein
MRMGTERGSGVIWYDFFTSFFLNSTNVFFRLNYECTRRAATTTTMMVTTSTTSIITTMRRRYKEEDKALEMHQVHLEPQVILFFLLFFLLIITYL